jgi:hypothetical protein
MKKNIEHRGNGDMRPEYDFAAMKAGVRGKHHKQYRKGTNVLIEPDVAAAFPTEDAVNEALRGILGTARAVRRTGGLPDDRAPQTVPGGPKRRIRRSTC